MVPKMVLNEKQKRYLFSNIMSKEDQVKIFETCDLEWLLKQKLDLREDMYGWKGLYMDNEKQTILNFPNNPGWLYDLEHIDELYQCQWCNDWFEKDEMVFRKRGFTKLCSRCDSYLASREGKGGY